MELSSLLISDASAHFVKIDHLTARRRSDYFRMPLVSKSPPVETPWSKLIRKKQGKLPSRKILNRNKEGEK
jgi:hypothetical protein